MGFGGSGQTQDLAIYPSSNDGAYRQIVNKNKDFEVLVLAWHPIQCARIPAQWFCLSRAEHVSLST